MEETQRNFELNLNFASLSAQLAALGIQHMKKQCCEEIKKLKHDYNRIKGQNNQRKPDHKTCMYYEFLDGILCHKKLMDQEFCCWAFGDNHLQQEEVQTVAQRHG